MQMKRTRTPEERSDVVIDLYRQVKEQYDDRLRKMPYYCESRGYRFVKNPKNRPFSIKVFSEILNINYTTVFAWVSGKRNPPDYVIEGLKTVLKEKGYEVKD